MFSEIHTRYIWLSVFLEHVREAKEGHVFVFFPCVPSKACPLDLYNDCFYENRRDAVDSRVQILRDASVETLHDMLEDVWTTQEGKVCSCINWDLFASLKQAQVFP